MKEHVLAGPFLGNIEKTGTDQMSSELQAVLTFSHDPLSEDRETEKKTT